MTHLIVTLRRNARLPVTLGMVAVLFLASCSKESAETTPTVAPTAAPAAVAPNNSASAPSGASPAPAAAPDARLAESQAAINSRDYEKAAATLVALRQAQLNAQQAEALAAQMRQFQSGLAAAVASGDARAKAAADKLRQSATVR